MCRVGAGSSLDAVSDMPCLKLAGLSLILHCSTSGKLDYSSEQPGKCELCFDKIKACKSGERRPPVYMGMTVTSCGSSEEIESETSVFL